MHVWVRIEIVIRGETFCIRGLERLLLLDDFGQDEVALFRPVGPAFAYAEGIYLRMQQRVDDGVGA